MVKAGLYSLQLFRSNLQQNQSKISLPEMEISLSNSYSIKAFSIINKDPARSRVFAYPERVIFRKFFEN